MEFFVPLWQETTKQTIMCTYTFTLDDKLVNSVSPQFESSEAMRSWLQRELEMLIIHRAAHTENMTVSPDKATVRKRIIDVASGKHKMTFSDLKGIFACSKRSAEDIRNDYLIEKYDL